MFPTPKANTASSRDVKLTEKPGRNEADWGSIYCFTARMRTGRGRRRAGLSSSVPYDSHAFLNELKEESTDFLKSSSQP